MGNFPRNRNTAFAIPAFLLGDLLFQILPEIPGAAWWPLPPAVLACSLALYPVRRWSLPIIGCMAGFSWAWIHAAAILDEELPEPWEGKEITIEGYVSSLPEKEERSLRFDFDLAAQPREGIVPAKIRLSWYEEAPPFEPGQRWQFTVRLKRPYGMMNPGGFDYERHLFQKGIRATGYIRADHPVRLISNHWYHFPFERARYTVREAMRTALTDSPFQAILIALVIGDQSGIEPGQWRVFNATGTNHLIAISGLHITLVAGMAFALLRLAWRWPALLTRLPAPKAAAAAAVVAAIIYTALSGFAVPAQRSLIMVTVAMAAVIAQRAVLPMHTLRLALLLVLIIDPLAPLNVGFWLSFGSVALILYAVTGRVRPGGFWWKWGRIHLVIAVGLLPAMVFLFGQTSASGPFANWIAVPVVSFIVVPLALAGAVALLPFPDAGALLVQAASRVMEALWVLLEQLAAVPLLYIPPPPLYALLLAIPGVLWLLAPRGWPARPVGLLWILPLLTFTPPSPAAGEAWVTLLDVGQGLATVVRTRHHALVFDTGPSFGPDFDTGATVIAPFLRFSGIGKIDTLIISHGDNDHIGGARSLSALLPIHRLLTGVPEKVTWRRGERCLQGERWQWDGVTFSVIHPSGETAGRSENDGSCVLRVETGGGSALLTGDIEARAERQLLEGDATLSADLLVAPHHGSKSSSIPGFVAAVSPRWVLFPVGYRNRYGFPHPSVVDRYRNSHALLLDSARDGAITIRLGREGNDNLLLQRYRRDLPRYWRTAAMERDR